MRILFIFLLTVIIAFVGYIRYLEAHSVFHPTKELLLTPAQIGLKFENIYIRTKDKSLINGWLIKHPQAQSTVLYFHGNAGNIADRLDKVALFHQMGVNVFIVDYRGYGKSQGKPSEHGIYEDAQAAYDYLSARQDIRQDKIICYGASLGGAVAIDLAMSRKLAALIVDSTFSSAADMGKAMYPWIPSFFLQTKMDSLSKVKEMGIPKLFIHSREDDLIPFALGKKLFDASAPPKVFVEVKGGHNDNFVQSQDVWVKGIENFLQEHHFK